MKIRSMICSMLVVALPTLACAQDAEVQGKLRPPGAFDTIKDPKARSAAMFVEAAKVIQSPRCLNCHPSLRSPTQGDDMHPHMPPLTAGVSNMGKPGLLCVSCHQSVNVNAPGTKFRSLPGHEKWSLAPASMAWQGLSLAEICGQIKDVGRNGGRSLTKISEHMGTDSLVGWAWHPGDGRVPAPGTQKMFGELIQAWIDTGAQCPK
jgi:hypothetical protein